MKLRNAIAALVAGSLLTAGVMFAGDAKADVAKAANCCVKAAKDGKTCTHACCIAAAKEGKNCEKCGGWGKLEPHKDEAKK
jgi:hypothetical protein